MIKDFMKKLFKKKEVTVLDKFNEIVTIAMNYEHPNKITKFIGIEYRGWRNEVEVMFWSGGGILATMTADFDSPTAIEDLEKIRVKLLKLIKTWEE